MPKAVVLLSGGLDSCTVAAMAKSQSYEVHALSFDYNQRHKGELDCAAAIGEAIGVASHRIMEVPLGALGGSALTDETLQVPNAPGEIGAEIPVTYVPARNTIFLSFALAVAEVEACETIFIGANALDYSGYPDCRPEYLQAFEAMAQLATKIGVEEGTPKIVAPLLEMTKAQIIQAAREYGAPLELTWSCYRGGKRACGTCESCALRLKGFKEAGLTDPIQYEEL